MRRTGLLILCATALAVCALANASGADTAAARPDPAKLPPVLRDVGIDQKLNTQVPLDLSFRDEQGNQVILGQYFHRSPVVLLLAYYDCPMLCTAALNGVLRSVKQLKLDLGRDFQVVTVSFSPDEQPSLAFAKKTIYVGLYGRPNASAGWHFLTGDQMSIRQLAQAVGFRYSYDPQSKQYFHATGIMILTPDGHLARYFYGVEYPAGNLRLALVEASQGRIGSPVDELLLYCSQYDPATGKYSIVVSHILTIAAAMTVVGLGGFLSALFLREKHSRTTEQVS
ncbi:MAG TPA: SCO family protein [Terriglobales bacterium]